MTTQRVDRSTLQSALYAAKAERGKHFREAWCEASHTIRWSGFVTALALSIAVFGGRYISGANAGFLHNINLASHSGHSR
jgi:hypothetical protein